MWTIKKYVGPHTCVTIGASQDHLRLDSDMIIDNIIPIVKAKPRIEIPVQITRISSHL